ncbi:MAG: hydrogenase 1 large subunit [Desulfovibrio sp.]|nr:hydrogenase 1 large subunit [Desulfovibrio sp.]
MSYAYTTQGFTVDSAGRRIVVDPITRIEGHLRCEVNINDDNVITNAVSCGTMFRGIELILGGRDPRAAWAYAQRICGVCTGTHALAAMHAVEDALGARIPDNANIIRNLMQLCLWFHDHLVHFYQLTGLDWIDVISAAKADPAETARLAQSLSPWPKASAGYFSELRDKIVTILNSGQLGIFANGYWGNPAYQLPPEANLMLFGHYLEALDIQREAVKTHTVFGGKNPHPNWIIGGVPCAINTDAPGGEQVINMERLELVSSIIDKCLTFAEQVLMPDVIALGRYYPNWSHIGTGLSAQSVLAYGAFPSIANDYSPASLMVPGGAIIDGNFNEVHPVDLHDPEQVQEVVGHAWYRYPEGVESLPPERGITDPYYKLGPATVGTPTDIRQLDEQGRYSWIKTPRWRGHMMEVGPLARLLVAYSLKHGDTVATVDELCGRIGIPVDGLKSTLGRIVARCHEALWAMRTSKGQLGRLMENIKNGDSVTAFTDKWEPATWPAKAAGVGFTEAPRGALGHWVEIENGVISGYQCVVPTTWNAAPRSDQGQLGAYEAALMGTRMAVPEQPLEILRTIHSFDPCLACATHVMSDDGNELAVVRLG